MYCRIVRCQSLGQRMWWGWTLTAKNIFQLGSQNWNIPVAFPFYFFSSYLILLLNLQELSTFYMFSLNACKLWETERSEMKLYKGRKQKSGGMKISEGRQACHCTRYIHSTWCSATAVSDEVNEWTELQ